ISTWQRPQMPRPPQTESRSTPSARAAASRLVPSANSPRFPDGVKTTRWALNAGLSLDYQVIGRVAARAPPPLSGRGGGSSPTFRLVFRNEPPEKYGATPFLSPLPPQGGRERRRRTATSLELFIRKQYHTRARRRPSRRPASP